ncbi:MAG: PilZ domain-containing protein [Rhodobacteraceae bacterium]|nr:PilZ domain-containing protein [Paracoccaceae bacterium]
MVGERRKIERKCVLRRARIVFRKGHSVIDCVLLDLSASGARLRASGLIALPERFELRIENGPSHAVEVAFRDFETTGVRFLDAV